MIFRCAFGGRRGVGADLSPSDYATSRGLRKSYFSPPFFLREEEAARELVWASEAGLCYQLLSLAYASRTD